MIIGFAIILVILILWQMLMPQRRPAPPAPTAPPTPVAESTPAPETTITKPSAPVIAPPIPETTAVLDNELITVTITSRGSGLKSCYLKPYRVQLVPEGKTILGLSELSAVPPTGLAQNDTAVTFTYNLPSGPVQTTWVIGKDYTLNFLINPPAPSAIFTFDGSAGIPVTESEVKEDLANFHFYARHQGKVHQIATSTLKKKTFTTSADWVGVKSKYFLLALINQQGSFDSARAEALPDGRIGFVAPAAVADSGRFLVYAGPIEYNRLRKFHLGLENVVSLGWLKPIALGILYLLRLFYQLIHNWGVAIILFSFLMKLVFYPLSRTQTKQMRQIQLLQPKIEELKKKYKNDPQTLNQETMRLYQLYRVNPLSGCLPLLLQMPVFFALYAVLRNFIELRGARFILWLKDLSQPDTLFGHIPPGVPLLGGFAIGLLPILMGVSFIAQNLITTTDRRNWAMTLIFPLFITAIFLNLSSGLQLYWFIYNILSILESLIATKGGKLWPKINKLRTAARS